MIRQSSNSARVFLRRLTSRAKNVREKQSELFSNPKPVQYQTRRMSTPARPEVPSLSSHITSEFASGRGTEVTIGVIGLAGAAFLLERWTAASSRSGAEFVKHGDHLEEVDLLVEELVEAVVEPDVDQAGEPEPSESISTEVVEGEDVEQLDQQQGDEEQPGAAVTSEPTNDAGSGLTAGSGNASEVDAGEEVEPSATDTGGVAGEDGKGEDSPEPSEAQGPEEGEGGTTAGGSLREPETQSVDGGVAEEGGEKAVESSGNGDGDGDGDGDGGGSFLGEVKAAAQEVVEKAMEEAGALLGAEDQPSHKEEEKDEDDCPFCRFMKGGPCRQQFVGWEDCVDDAEKQGLGIVEHCIAQTHELKVCMEANPEYYGPILEAEKGLADEEEEQTGSEPEGSQVEGASVVSPSEPDAGQDADVDGEVAIALADVHAGAAEGSGGKEASEGTTPGLSETESSNNIGSEASKDSESESSKDE